MHISTRINLCIIVVAVVISTTLTSCSSSVIEPSTSSSYSSNTQDEVNIAYFIQVSAATLTLLPRLLRTLWHPKNLYIVHFDKKIPSWQRSHTQISLFRSKNDYTSNVIILEPEPVTYRGISMVLNIFSAMQASITHAIQWTFFINISGADYPLVSAENQRRLLSSSDFASRNRSFLTLSERDWWQRSKSFRYDRLFTDTSLGFNDSNAQVVDSFIHHPLADIHNFTFVAAEAWMILHRSFVSYLLTSSTSRRLLLAFSYSLEPEEHFFPAAIYNEPKFNQSTVPHALRHVVWNHNGKHAGQHPYYVDKVNTQDGSWTFRESISKSGCFFTRKIRIPDSNLLDWIDEHISGVAEIQIARTDVDEFLTRVSNILMCIADLHNGDQVDTCFPNSSG